eukprot:CAMPEP_0179170330 /NCGR_PEP_ID=MMETSP0796-20121207/83901_1 /TAXON_ID=73915 /ORGANISM="Pyrodinium bahamense, Strain pbaha01" /LENGTH=45 /DNA_ID= /DNA_START= /DNA_END= /DNA_ORIENTATION=
MAGKTHAMRCVTLGRRSTAARASPRRRKTGTDRPTGSHMRSRSLR